MTVDGVVVAKRRVLAGGELVRVVSPSAAAPAGSVPDPQFAVSWEDEHLIVVDKPAGVVVHPGRGNRAGTLAQALAGTVAGGQDPERAGIVHRLDRDTSGLLVLARSEPVHAALKQLLAKRRLVREYLALVEGRPPARRGTIDAPLGRDRRVRTRVSTETDEPRDAITHFEVEQALPHDTLLRVRLDTGRTHQIRAHCSRSATRSPAIGSTARPGRHGLQRQFLHAARLAFPHPVTGVAVDVSSPLPPDLAAALQVAGR